jgi:hypothetical protein
MPQIPSTNGSSGSLDPANGASGTAPWTGGNLMNLGQPAYIFMPLDGFASILAALCSKLDALTAELKTQNQIEVEKIEFSKLKDAVFAEMARKMREDKKKKAEATDADPDARKS